MLIDLVQLRTFVAVAEEQHLTRAADRLHVSVSAASAHVRAIEEFLDTQLFVRTNRSLELTPAGQVLLRQAKTLLNEAAEFRSFAREIRGKVGGNVVVGLSSDPSTSRIGGIVAALCADNPLVTVDLRALPSMGVRQALKTGELDIGILLCHPVDPGFRYFQLDTVAFKIAGPAAWRERIAKADWAELASLPWIAPSRSSIAYTSMLSKMFGDKGLELNSIVQFDNATIARAMLHAGVGMMLIREEHAVTGEQEGHLAVSPLAREEFGFFMAHVATRGNDPLIKAFLAAAESAWPNMNLMAVPGRHPSP